MRTTTGLSSSTPPRACGLYDPRFEHDACGVGFVADVAGRPSHDVIARALRVLVNLQHRGGCGAEPGSGDGAGILIQMPDRFARTVAAARRINLPAPGEYGSGLVFLPKDSLGRGDIERRLEVIVHEEGQVLLGWRPVPIEDAGLGASAAAARPFISQVFIGAGADTRTALQRDPLAFERKLYVIRRRLEQAAGHRDRCYVPSLSSRTFVYKGMLRADQLESTFPDLAADDMESAIALVHQRFSTNTFPSWSLAHPYRLIAHNGEINTLQGNLNWMRARERLLASAVFGDDLGKILPVVTEGGSDTAALDNVLELLVLAGRSLPHALLMTLPEPWEGRDDTMSAELRAFYEYHATVMEPWDGPAAVCFTDGTLIGATLDRNGLRPLRYYVLRNGTVVMASEVGVLDVPPGEILRKGRVRPGEMFLVDTARGRIVPDDETKQDLAAAHPYADWLAQQVVHLDEIPLPTVAGRGTTSVGEPLKVRQLVFGYTDEDLRVLLAPMASSGEEPVGSMGSDTALAVLSERPRLLYDYFKQAFAQVTNPPLDAIRERLVTSMASTIGREGNLLDPTPPNAPGAEAGPAAAVRLSSVRRVRLDSPVIDNDQLARLRQARSAGFDTTVLPILFDPVEPDALDRAIDELQQRASAALAGGCTILILSDRDADRRHAPMPSLLATAAVHQHLVRAGTRTQCGLVIETGDAREVHHCALLLAYGAGAINPWLALDSLPDLVDDGYVGAATRAEAVERYLHALDKGILKVMSKMGISTLQSYCGAQIFEAIGLDRRLVDRCFTGTPSPIGGIGLDGIARETVERHRRAYPTRPRRGADLPSGGDYQWRRDGEHRLFTPETVFRLQHATRSGQYDVFKSYTALVDDQSRRAATLRGLFELRCAATPLPLDEIEPADAIIRRFATGAMSYGSISEEAHTTLAIAMNRLGARSNTGEGGEDPARFDRDASGDWRRSAVKQIASGRFGVTSEYLVNAEELQIKMAQGAKPGEGGQLPGAKVYPWIARVRRSTPGVGLISPPPHHDIYSIEDLAQLIYDLKCANPQARVSVKLVSLAGVGTIAAGVAKAKADAVLISGHDGGTGAAPLTSIKHAGVPWELGLAETQQVLRLNGLRSRITVQADGQMKTGRDVAIAALLGAEEFGFATAPLVVSGCVMMRVCHLNTCPVGIATQDPGLRARFTGRPEFVMTFFRFIAEEVREYMAALGFRTMDEMIGRVDHLQVRSEGRHWKSRTLDLTPILHAPALPDAAPRRQTTPQDHELDRALDRDLIDACRDALTDRLPVRLTRTIRNSDRAAGTMLGAAVTRRWGGTGLPDETIRIAFTGSAGQSFGAFLPRGITLTLEGDANDYVGKGLSGGRLVLSPPRRAAFAADENVIAGNVVLYGATGGEAYIRGMAGERFAVRNSGAEAVVEGVGDHGCEYMTGGRVAVLGRTGRNFAAGMTGGIAYVLDTGGFAGRCNTDLVDLERVDSPADRQALHDLLSRHAAWTSSTVAARLLAAWPLSAGRFVKVMPREYRQALAAQQAAAPASDETPLEYARVGHG